VLCLCRVCVVSLACLLNAFGVSLACLSSSSFSLLFTSLHHSSVKSMPNNALSAAFSLLSSHSSHSLYTFIFVCRIARCFAYAKTITTALQISSPTWSAAAAVPVPSIRSRVATQANQTHEIAKATRATGPACASRACPTLKSGSPRPRETRATPSCGA
jgi:hypothetical protein